MCGCGKGHSLVMGHRSALTFGLYGRSFSTYDSAVLIVFSFKSLNSSHFLQFYMALSRHRMNMPFPISMYDGY